MKNLFIILIACLIVGCSHKIKTYYPNGKIETDCTLDKDGKKNGLYRWYDTSGYVRAETQIRHDTLSGLVKDFFSSSNKVYICVRYSPIYYPDTITPMLVLSDIRKYTNVETFIYDKQGNIEKYYLDYLHGRKDFTVKYKNDSISEIWSDPHIYNRIDDKSNTPLKPLSLIIINIPKCKTNAWILDSADIAIDSCMGCKEFDTRISFKSQYTLRVEYVDSTFGIRHRKKIPITNPNGKKFPSDPYWKREY